MNNNDRIIKYIKLFIKGLFNKTLRKKIMSYDKAKENYYYIEKLGDENNGKIVFLYDENSFGEVGFFAIYRFMIEACWFCEKYGFIPVFHWGDNCFYAENNAEINGKKDAYEHFYQQPGQITYESALKSNAVIRSSYIIRDTIRKRILGDNVEFLGYEINDSYFKLMAEYANKYIRLNLCVEEQLMNDIRELLGGKKTLGIHIRIKVFQKGIDKHPIASKIEEYIGKAAEALNNYNFEQIFIATEELDAIELFKQKFAGKVVYYNDVLRNEKGDIIFEQNAREHHKYLLGYEVQRDMYTLAYCDGLIAGLSQVSFCAQITKYQMKSNYDFKCIFDKGINRSTLTVKKAYKQYSKKGKK